MIDIEKIHQNIESASKDARFEAWLTLYRSPESAAAQEIERIITQHDPLLKVRFCQFLADVGEEKSINYLTQLLADENTIVVTKAIKAFEKNSWSNKAHKIVGILAAPNQQSRDFAVDTLCVAQISEAVAPLLQMLTKADEKFLQRILAGLRLVADRRIVADVLPFVKDSREKVRFYALLALGAVYGKNAKKLHTIFVNALFDPAHHIRQAAVWCLKRLPNKSDIARFIKLAKEDTEVSVRLEALTALADFGTVKTLKIMVSLIVDEKSTTVCLKGESTLLSTKPKLLVKTLKSLLKSKNKNLRNKALMLYASFNKGSRDFCLYLERQYNKVQSDQERVTIIEGLGRLGHPAAISLLEKQIGKSLIITYASMAALAKVWSGQDGFPTLHYLHLIGMNNITRQIVLKHHVKHVNGAISDELFIEFTKLMLSVNLNLRYLSAQALIKSGHHESLIPLFQCYLTEQDSTAALLIRENLIKFISINPMDIMVLFDSCAENEIAILSVFTLLREVALDKEPLVTSLARWINPPYCILSKAYAPAFLDLIMGKLQKRELLIGDLLSSIHSDKDRVAYIAAMLGKMARYPHLRVSVSDTLINSWLVAENTEKSQLIVNLLGYCQPEQSIPALVSVICRGNSGLEDSAAQSLSQVLHSR